ncbi:flagellar motor switch protein FliN [Angustibacter luteus]|uniref:Flagellar motor switch protein FliN n=1 Tax=Angustibacter luteus TaxID=658456 RepID=A0ABW1JI50_9ACTN
MTTITHLEQDVLATAQAVADLLPTSAPLSAGQVMSLDEAASSIPPDAVAAHADVLGARVGSVVVIVQRELAASLADSPMGPLPLVDALRPALEALRVALGVGTLATVAETTAAGAITLLQAQDATIIPLQGTTGPAAWIAVSAAPSSAAAPAARPAGPSAGMELLQDVVMELSAELGRTTMTVRELLNLQPGAVVELDRLAGSPADLLVNGRLIARGEVVVVDEDYALKITELISSSLPDHA